MADLERVIKGRIRHDALIISGGAFWSAAFFLAASFGLTWTMPLFYAAVMYSMLKMVKIIIWLSKGEQAGVLQAFVCRNHKVFAFIGLGAGLTCLAFAYSVPTIVWISLPIVFMVGLIHNIGYQA